MNDKHLIALVHAQPVLYDQSNSRYMDTDLKNAIWNQVGAKMNTDGSLCKTRWSNIRDNFRKSLNKQKTKSGHKAKNVRPYKYSHQLQFLVKFFEEKEIITNLNEVLIKHEPMAEEEKVSEAVFLKNEEDTIDVIAHPVIVEVEDKNATNKSTDTKSIRRRRKKLPNDSPPKTAADTHMEDLVKRNENTTSPIHHPVDAFLAGIAPVLKKLPPKEWHFAKGEIFNVVQKYEFNAIMNQQSVHEQRDLACFTPSQSSEPPSPSGSYSHQSSSGNCEQSQSQSRKIEEIQQNYSFSQFLSSSTQ